MVEESASQHDSQWAAITSIANKIGYTPETLRRWVRQHETDAGLRTEPTTAEQEKIRALKREVKELCKTNEILRMASAFSPRRNSTAASSLDVCSGHPIPDTTLSFSSVTAGANPSLN